MTFLAIGIVILISLAILARLFSSADPILLTKVLRWSLIILGVFFALYYEAKLYLRLLQLRLLQLLGACCVLSRWDSGFGYSKWVGQEGDNTNIAQNGMPLPKLQTSPLLILNGCI